MGGRESRRRLALLMLFALVSVSGLRFSRRAPEPFSCPGTPLGLAGVGSTVRLVCPERVASDARPPAEYGPAVLVQTGPSAYRPFPMPVAARRTMGLPIDLNRMSREDFEQLPGIGPALSRRIVHVRAALGGFTAIEDLDRVPGIGPAKLDALRSLLGDSGR